MDLPIIVIVTNVRDKVACPTIVVCITFILTECEALVIAVTLALAVSVVDSGFSYVGIFRGRR